MNKNNNKNCTKKKRRLINIYKKTKYNKYKKGGSNRPLTPAMHFIIQLIQEFSSIEIINNEIITLHNLITAIKHENYYNNNYFTQIQTRLINTLIANIKILGIFKKILNNQNVNYTTRDLYSLFNTYKQNSEEINEILNIQSHQDLIDALNLETLVRGETLRDDFVTRQPGFFVKAKSA